MSRIQDLAYRADVLDKLMASARAPRHENGRVIVEFDPSAWFAAQIAAAALRPGQPIRRDPKATEKLRSAIRRELA